MQLYRPIGRNRPCDSDSVYKKIRVKKTHAQNLEIISCVMSL
jgi:hypothetical protein